MSTDAPEPVCPSCRRPVAGGADDCPHCGEDMIAAGRERVRTRFRRTKTLLTLALVGGFLCGTRSKDKIKECPTCRAPI